MVKDTIGSPPGEVGVNMYMECDTYSIQCFDAVGRDEEIWPVKSWFVGDAWIFVCLKSSSCHHHFNHP